MNNKASFDKCPCCSGKVFETCCGPYLAGEDIPGTPEQLMRSRYTAFTLSEIDYISRTMKGPALKQFNRVFTKQWADNAVWKKLEIIDAPEVEPNSDKGVVEYIASYEINGTPQTLHECSAFILEDGCWYYFDGKHINQHQPKREKVGRNEPCICGSGKKYKKCCGA